MAPCRPSDFAIIKAAADGDLCLLKEMAGQMDLREAKDDEGKNALHAAAANGHLEVCRFLLEESGLDVNCTTADGVTPVACAAAAGNKVGVLRYLLDHGGDPAMPDARGITALHRAADLGHYDAVRLLLSKGGVDVDGLNCQRSPPLHLAAGKGHDQAVQVLLEHGADPNRVTHNMFSPLIMACSVGSFKCTKLLVEAGADVNFKNFFGMTALSMANDNADIVNLLLKAGADPNISDNKDKKRTIDDARPEGNLAFAKGDYLAATFAYTIAMLKDTSDATLVSNRSLCWLRLGDGKLALLDAQLCKSMRPRWSKAWYREGAALSLLKDYEGAVNAFTEALKRDPANDEIKKALREATDSLKNAGYSGEENP